jgi:Fur family peroxide stress response transcriptional regulator
LAICRALADAETHPTAAQMFEQVRADFPTLSLATVYSTLNTFASLGLVFELGNAGDGQKHYDPDTAPHANLICTRCHRIRDLDDTALEAVSTRVAKKSGYQIQGARIVYYGVCPACSKRRNR